MLWKDRRNSNSGNESSNCIATKTDAATTDGSQDQTRSMSESSSTATPSRASYYSRRNTGLGDDTERALPLEKERSTRQRISGRLECANLRFSNLHVVGREDEIGALRLAYGRARGRRAKRTTTDLVPEEETALSTKFTKNENVAFFVDKENDASPTTREKELVFIAGTSGCGKSKLASTLADRVEKSGGLFVQGKYDLYFRDEPYFGISQACSEIVGHLLQLNGGGEDHDNSIKFGMVCDLLKKEIGDELHLLANVIPPIVEIVGEECIKARDEPTHSKGGYTKKRMSYTNINLEQSREQFNYVFKKFFRVITSDQSILGGPLVMTLDDWQWADASSIELLEILLTDRDISGLLIVGCYRSEEVMGTHILSNIIRKLRDESESQRLNMTELALDHLTTNDVNTILMELLSIDDVSKTMPLAEICHKRSMGNPFHLMTFLRMLQDERFLEFNLGSFRWIFDVEKIEKKTSAASNVVDIVTKRLEKVPTYLQEVLHIAACLGSSFEFGVLYLVWNEMRQVEESSNQLDIYLEEAIELSVLEADGDLMRYRWTHDKVQESAMVLGDQASDGSIQVDVGLVLLEKFTQLNESIVFAIANLLQCESASNLDKKKCYEIVQINLKAAQRAVACSAFKSAAKYVKNGVALLPVDAFSEKYDLALELFTLGTEVEGCIGNDDQMQEYYDEVIVNVRSSLDKIRCCNVKLSRLGSTKRTKMACNLCIDILNELGTCKISRNPVAQKVKAIMVLQKVKDVSPESLHALPLMTDPVQLATMTILNHLATYSNLCDDTFLLILASFDMYQRTLKQGLCPLTTSAFTTLAVVRCAMSNFPGGKLFCDLALSLLPKFDSKADLSRTYFISYFMVKPWTTPYSNCLKYLHEAYRTGLECGDTESGCWGIVMYLLVNILRGTSLVSIEADIRNYMNQILDLGREEQALHLQIYFQYILCLTGHSDNPTEMIGEAIPDAETFEHELQSIQSKMALVIYEAQQTYLCSLFGEHERGAKMALERGDALFRVPAGCPPAMQDTFHRGVSLFEMARRTRKKKYKRAAKNILSTMRKWVKSDNPNVIHTTTILEAEQFALGGYKVKACQTYEKAVTLSIRQGMLQDAALASERYGEYLLNVVDDKDKAVYCFEKALRYYKDWGADAKVAQINEKYSYLYSVPSKIEIP